MTELNMVARRESEFDGFAPAPHLEIIFLAVTHWHVIRQQVRQAQLNIAELALHGL
jgi:hypothetical protein